MAFEGVTQVEHRLMQDVSVGQQQRDQQPTDSSIAVQERVNRLELGVNEAAVDQHREIVPRMQKTLEVVERVPHPPHRRRDERRVGKRHVAGTDPIPRRAELPRLLVGTAHVAREFGVNLTNEPQRQRK